MANDNVSETHALVGKLCMYCGVRVLHPCRDDKTASVCALGVRRVVEFPRSATKPTNPKDAVGIRKVPFHVVPPRVVAEVGLALLEGARKYGSYNWRAAGVRASVYFDAMNRHMADFWEGVDTDPDSGVSHVTKAIASLVVLRDSMMQGNWVDDRPIRGRFPEEQLAAMNRQAGGVIDRYPEAKEPFTEKKTTNSDK